MNVIVDLLEAVKGVKESLKSHSWTKECLDENEATVCDMNSQIQLYEQGVNALGVSISDYMPYRPKTIEIKEIKGQPTNRVTLRDEGDFHASFFLNLGAESFVIDAKDEKRDGLVRKYGRQIFGLTDENRAELIWEYLFPHIMSNMKKSLNIDE